MKKTSIIFYILLSIMFTMMSCNNATYLNVDEDEIVANINGAEGMMSISTDGTGVEIVQVPSWVKATIDDNVLHYTVGINTDKKAREGLIVLQCGDISCDIKVKQAFKATYVKFSPEKVVFPNTGGTETVSVETDGASMIMIDSPFNSGNKNFATIDGKVITIKLSKNNSAKLLAKTIRVKCDDIVAELEVTQASSACLACDGDGFLNRPCSTCGGDGCHDCSWTCRERCSLCHGSGIR